MASSSTSTFTTRLDTALKAELERIARQEKRSASFMVKQAIENMVSERKATHELIGLGLELIQKQSSAIPAEDIHAWILIPGDDTPFPSVQGAI